MIKKYNRLSLFYGIPGFLLQGLVFLPALTFKILGLLGLVLFIIGLGCYVKSIGHHPAWGLLGLLSWIGIIVILCFKDTTLTYEEKQSKKITKTKDMILGILFGISLVVGAPLIIAIIFMFFVK